jgi:hypothetical protein
MMTTLPSPKVLRCYLEESFTLGLPAMCLRWECDANEVEEHQWELPEGVTLRGPLPERFGISIRRERKDAYRVRLLWDRTYLVWQDLPRAQILDSVLAPLLAAMGTDLWYLLEQPVQSSEQPQRAA